MKSEPEERMWNAFVESKEAAGEVLDPDKMKVRRSDFMAGYAAGWILGSSTAIHNLPDIPIETENGEIIGSHTRIQSPETAIDDLVNGINSDLLDELAAGESESGEHC